jgi:hypothetical protein
MLLKFKSFHDSAIAKVIMHNYLKHIDVISLLSESNLGYDFFRLSPTEKQVYGDWV